MSFNIEWIILLVYVFTLLFIDFFVLHKKEEVIKSKKVLLESLFFMCNALIFSVIVYFLYKNNIPTNKTNLTPADSVIKYITGYLIELSLSVDNLFVIAVIFTNFKIPTKNQHRLLFLGILGAIIFRATLISFGLLLMDKIHSITIFFGLFLLFTAFKMLKKEDENSQNKSNGKIARFFKISDTLDGDKYLTKINGKYVFTALFGALITIEFTDILFALDSIPAIFAITTDPFIVFSSNIFAIMGLRSLYFFLANMLEKFKKLKYSIFFILLFVSIKLIIANWITIPEWISLTFIFLSLLSGVLLSLKKEKKA
jgi:tellurite resistance protein TerC